MPGQQPRCRRLECHQPRAQERLVGGYKDQIAIPREELGGDPSYGEVSAYWQRRALRFMSEQPGRFVRLLLKKAALFWGSREFPNNQDYNFFKLHSWVLGNPAVNFGVVAPLALVGVFVLLPSWRNLYLTYAFLVTSFAVTIAFFICARSRAPVLPVLCVFAGCGVEYMVRSIRMRKHRRLAIPLLGLTGAALLVNLNPAGVPLPNLAQSHTQTGKVYLEIDEEDLAAAQFREALEADPGWAEAYEQLGLIEMKRGRTSEATAFLEKAVKINPEQATAHRALAMLHLSMGDLDEARRSVLNALEAAPYLEDSHNVLGSIERQAGNQEAALRAFYEEIGISPDNWRAYANLGSLHETLGNNTEAETAYLTALELQPENSELILALAGIYSRQGRKEDARRLLASVAEGSAKEIDLRYNQAAMLQNDGEIEEARRIYEGILAEEPYHERSLVNLGVIYARQGADAKAMELWRRALEVNPENPTARRNIELLRQQTGGPR